MILQVHKNKRIRLNILPEIVLGTTPNPLKKIRTNKTYSTDTGNTNHPSNHQNETGIFPTHKPYDMRNSPS